MKTHVQKVYIILSTVICAVMMSFVDGVWQPGYIVKSLIKIALFLLVPLSFFLFRGEWKETMHFLFVPKTKSLLIAVLLGVGVYGVILGAYTLFNAVYDITDLVLKATSQNGVSAHNFLWVSLYISFANSLLEEFLFRGFAFLRLKKETSRLFAYGFSALAFAFYHLGMIATGMHPGISFLAMVGLFVAGIVLNFLNEKSGSLLTSWLVHMFANFAINTIGFMIIV